MDLNRPAGCGEDVAPYALGALPHEDARRFRAHLDDCALCRADLEILQPVIDALPDTIEPVDPPPALRKRIMAVVEEEAAQRRRSTQPVRRWLGVPVPRAVPALAAACVLLIAGLGVGLAVSGGGGETRTFTGTAPTGASAQMRVEPDHTTLVVRGMPNPPSGRMYQVWLVRGKGAPEPTRALFTTRRGEGAADVEVPGDMQGVTKVLVSHEPRGGSRAPTSDPVIQIST